MNTKAIRDFLRNDEQRDLRLRIYDKIETRETERLISSILFHTRHTPDEATATSLVGEEFRVS